MTFSSSTLAKVFCVIMFGAVAFMSVFLIFAVTQAAVQHNPSVPVVSNLGSGDLCTLCNSSLGCALQIHQLYPYKTPSQVQDYCQSQLCATWQPSSVCINFWLSAQGRAVVRAAWYNISSYCTYSPSCSGNQPTAPPSPSISGACCKSGMCSIVTSRNCSGGTYQGDYSTCQSSFCGACCDDVTCTDANGQSMCSGVYQGDATVCGGQCGACSYNATTCKYTIPTTCNVGTYLGRGVYCGASPGTTSPPTQNGACCYLNPSTNHSLCSVGTTATCTTLGGVYLGANTDCSQQCGACYTPQVSYPLTYGNLVCTNTQQRYCGSSEFITYQWCAQTDTVQVCIQEQSCLTVPAPCYVTALTQAYYECPVPMAGFSSFDLGSGVGHGCFANNPQVIGDCWCNSNSTCQTVPAGYCMQSGCTFEGTNNNMGTCPNHGSCTLAPTPSPPTTQPPPTTASPPPAPTGTTYGTCCVMGVSTKNITAAACHSAGAAVGSTGYWFPVVPDDPNPACRACCGITPLTVFSCTAGLYYNGGSNSTYTCSAFNGYINPSSQYAKYCADATGGYKCNRCWNQPNTTIVVQAIGSADPSMIWNPPSDCVVGSFYNNTGIVVGSGQTVSTAAGTIQVSATTTDSANAFDGAVANSVVWPRSAATGSELFAYNSVHAVPGIFIAQVGGIDPWIASIYLSFQDAPTDPKYAATFSLFAIDGYGNAAVNYQKTGAFSGTPIGWIVWSNVIRISTIRITDVDSPGHFYIGDINVRI